MTRATAFWVEAPGRGALRTEEVADPPSGHALVRTLLHGHQPGHRVARLPR